MLAGIPQKKVGMFDVTSRPSLRRPTSSEETMYLLSLINVNMFTITLVSTRVLRAVVLVLLHVSGKLPFWVCGSPDSKLIVDEDYHLW